MNKKLKNNDMKRIELTPEWILDHYNNAVTVDENADVILSTGTIESANWIELALDTLRIEYRSEEHGQFDDEPQCMWWTQYTFRLSDIKQECPIIYNRLYEIYLSNLFRNRNN
jgi:hypothetical protein